jgi:uncharacterized protein (DUF1015 family)
MVNIRPFRGYRYNEKKVDVSKAIFPPYELANKNFREIFLKMSEYNIIKVVWGNDKLKSNGDRYKFSGELFRSWIKNGYLKKEQNPSFYAYLQEFEINGKKMGRLGLVALVELEEMGKNIFPHECTLQETMKNRKLLTENTKANLGLVFSLYSDPQKRLQEMLLRATKKPPVADFFTEYEGVRHKIWVIEDKGTIEKIKLEMKNKKLLVADGHHRYNNSLEYSKNHPELEGAKYRLMMLIDINDKGLAMLPTHRVVKGLKNFKKEQFIESLKKYFEVSVTEFDDCCGENELRKILRKIDEMEGEHKFGMYMGDKKLFILRLKDEKVMNIFSGKHSERWKKFDTNILHSIVFGEILKFDTSDASEQYHVEYIKDISKNILDCIKTVRNGESQIAFFVNNVKTEDVKEISENGEIVPPKSTCFYPKVYTGAIMYKFDDN